MRSEGSRHDRALPIRQETLPVMGLGKQRRQGALSGREAPRPGDHSAGLPLPLLRLMARGQYDHAHTAQQARQAPPKVEDAEHVLPRLHHPRAHGQ